MIGRYKAPFKRIGDDIDISPSVVDAEGRTVADFYDLESADFFTRALNQDYGVRCCGQCGLAAPAHVDIRWKCPRCGRRTRT